MPCALEIDPAPELPILIVAPLPDMLDTLPPAPAPVLVHPVPARTPLSIPIVAAPRPQRKSQQQNLAVTDAVITEFALGLDERESPYARTHENEFDEWLPGVVIDCH